MPIFTYDAERSIWSPSPLAAGPFAGLQGGAVAGLLTGEIEAASRSNGWGWATSMSAWFFRPVPMAALRTRPRVVSTGGRVTIVDNTLTTEGSEEPCATVRVTLMRSKPIALPDRAGALEVALPEACPARKMRAPHGMPWFMDAMEARSDDRIAWFNPFESIIEGAGPLSRVVGPADWAHGIRRPVQNYAADPNPNLTVHLARSPRGKWIGIEARAIWEGTTGIGVGRGTLIDVEGEIGSVSMAVALSVLRAADRSAA